MWIPSHISIRDNEQADQAASEASNSEGQDGGIPIPHKDIVSHIKSRVLQVSQVWQDEWGQYSGYTRQIKSTVVKQTYSKGLSRKEQVLLCRLRIGHTNLTHFHLFNRDPIPRCPRSNEVLTMEHVLICCTLYEHIERN
nr:unnamed protein product [Callosobruchus chinensis]